MIRKSLNTGETTRSNVFSCAVLTLVLDSKALQLGIAASQGNNGELSCALVFRQLTLLAPGQQLDEAMVEFDESSINGFSSIGLEYSRSQTRDIAHILQSFVIVPQDLGLARTEFIEAPFYFTLDAAINAVKSDVEVAKKVNEMLEYVTYFEIIVHSNNTVRFKLRGDGYPEREVQDMSGGQRDAFAACVALSISQARFVLLDEPGQNLGIIERHRLRNAIDDSLVERREPGDVRLPRSAVVVTHHREMLRLEDIPGRIVSVRMSFGRRFGKPQGAIKSSSGSQTKFMSQITKPMYNAGRKVERKLIFDGTKETTVNEDERATDGSMPENQEAESVGAQPLGPVSGVGNEAGSRNPDIDHQPGGSDAQNVRGANQEKINWREKDGPLKFARILQKCDGIESAYFGDGVFLVEGKTDKVLLEELDRLLATNEDARENLGIQRWSGFCWPIVAVQGSKNICDVEYHFKEEMHIQVFRICDFDVLLRELECKGGYKGGHWLLIEDSALENAYKGIESRKTPTSDLSDQDRLANQTREREDYRESLDKYGSSLGEEKYCWPSCISDIEGLLVDKCSRTNVFPREEAFIKISRYQDGLREFGFCVSSASAASDQGESLRDEVDALTETIKHLPLGATVSEAQKKKIKDVLGDVKRYVASICMEGSSKVHPLLLLSLSHRPCCQKAVGALLDKLGEVGAALYSKRS